MAAARWIDAHTPTLSAVDSRGLAVRNVGYQCHPLNLSIESRVTRNQFDPAGRLLAAWDPRLGGTAPKANLENTLDLPGRPLLVDSVDAGWQLSLLDQAGSLVSIWDGRGSQRRTEYDELQRPVAVVEQMAGEPPRVSDRFVYAAGETGFAARNQCGQLIRHDHPVGRRRCCEYGVGGLLLTEQTRFLADLEPVDWSADLAEGRLETEVFETSQQYGPAGEMQRQTDAMRNVRSFAYDRAGQLCETRLQLADSSAESRLLLSDVQYDAVGRSTRERSGNGVISTARFSDDDGRLLQLQACRAEGQVLQDFHYEYDPVGNIIGIEDRAQPTSYLNNQRLDPVCRYVYDSLYQLIEATGCEVSQPSHGPALPTWRTTPLDPHQLRHYTQTFSYDAGGNLLTRHHSGADKFEMFTAVNSNRSVADKEQLADGFDANGNQLELLRGQRLHWNIRNELSRVTLVKRDDGPDDSECYGYDQPGHRLRKVCCAQTARRTRRAEVRYLPGLEIHRDNGTGAERHVVIVEAGCSIVRALHWVTKLPRGVGNDQLRYCLSNHLNSSTLELDEKGAVLSREVYYPFGGTALWAGTDEIEAKYKTVRYSGKERDATGLYYYGYRYYAPWLQRWVSPDPAGEIDGLNVFVMLLNNPVNWVDESGTTAVPTVAHFFWGGMNINAVHLSNVLTFKMHNPEYKMNVWVDKSSHIFNTLSAMEGGDDPVHRELARRFGKELSVNEPHELFNDLAMIYPGARKVESLFHREINGAYRNIPAASDILRMSALYVHGGIYMDVDVAVLSHVERLQASKGFLAYVAAGALIANSTMAALPQSSLGLEFIKDLVAFYDKYDHESWTKKRNIPFYRREDTLYWTGPGLIQDAVRKDRLFIFQDKFSFREPQATKAPTKAELLQAGVRSQLFNRGIMGGYSGRAEWITVKAGRRASIG